MYKVLLVDDEPLAIEGLMLMIDWPGLGFEVCGFCENGIEALKMMEAYHPDVVVTDIEMPFMNGLELIERSLSCHPNSIFVVLSGYSDFEYAQKALLFGVHHYMLKPFMDEEAIEILSDIHNKLDERKLNAEMVQYGLQIKLERIVWDMVDGNLEDLDVLDEQELVELTTYSDHCSHWYYLHMKMEQSDDLNIRGVVKLSLYSIDPIIVLDRDLHTLGIILGVQQSQDIHLLVNDLERKLKQGTSAKFSLCIGDSTTSLLEIRQSYLGALMASAQLFYMDDQSIIFQHDVTEQRISYDPKLLNHAARILEFLESIDQARCDQAIVDMFNEFLSDRTSQKFIRMFIHHIIHQSILVLSEYGEEIPYFNKQQLLTELNRSTNTISDMKRILDKYCLDVREHYLSIRASRSNDLLTKVQAYLHEHYLEDRTIKEIATHHYVHPVYLGKAFSDKHGMGIREYMYMLRINEAKKLLVETQIKANKVAEAVGYTSYPHFLKHFERWVGQKPSDYRNGS